ncbi:MAG: hypothetical protein OEY49_14800, partial [Candidatus Heimdallarchaeota archaeon]|nr:hypothetical protein [Candidatus Heimdallarchaeota archaeon]
DCVEVCNLLGLEGNNYLVLASSLGATTVIYAMAQNEIFPSNVVLVGPTTEFRVPLTIRLLLPVTNYWTYRNIGKKILKQIVMRKFTDEKADPFQKKKYSLALDLADPVRLKKCIRAWYKTTIYNEFPLIDGKRSFCYLIGASEDKLHPDRDSKLASESIENAKFIDLKTNSAAHDKPLIDLIDKTIMN